MDWCREFYHLNTFILPFLEDHGIDVFKEKVPNAPEKVGTFIYYTLKHVQDIIMPENIGVLFSKQKFKGNFLKYINNEKNHESIIHFKDENYEYPKSRDQVYANFESFVEHANEERLSNNKNA